MTIAATLATAPLIAFHFETLSTTTLVANLLALPAVAPAMWLGMVERRRRPGARACRSRPLNGLNALLLGYIAQVAAWCGRPSWAEVHVRLGGAGLLGSYLGARRRSSRPRPRSRRRRRLARARRRGATVARGACRRRSAPSAAAAGAGGACGCSSLLARSAGRRRRGRRPRRSPGCGSRCSTSARATRSCCSRPARRRSWSTAGRPATTSPAKLRGGRRRAARRGGRHPRPVRPRRRGRRAARPLPGRPARLRARWRRSLLDAARAAGAVPVRVAGGRRAALRRPAPARSSGRRASCWPKPLAGHRPEPAGAGPPRPLARLLDAADRRRRGRGGAARPGPGRRAQGRPPRQRRRRPRRPCSTAPMPRAGGDLGRRRQLLRAPDRREPWRPSPRTASAPCAPIDDGTVEIDVDRGAIAVESGG